MTTKTDKPATKERHCLVNCSCGSDIGVLRFEGTGYKNIDRPPWKVPLGDTYIYCAECGNDLDHTAEGV